MCDLPGSVLAGIAAGRLEAVAATVLEVASLVEDGSDPIAASAMDFGYTLWCMRFAK